MSDRILFTWSDDGRRLPLMEPAGRRENANFLILWNGKDWSGFATFSELQTIMTELERSQPPAKLHMFDAVERI